MKFKRLRKAAGLIAIGLMGIVVQNGSAATVGDFEVDFLDVMYNVDGTSTWTYKVSSDSDTRTSALSHWTLKLCPDAHVVSPTGTYETITPFVDGGGHIFTGRSGIFYTVVLGNDATTGISGIKFEDAVDAAGDEANLGEDGIMEMDIFQFTLDKHYVVDDTVMVATKASGEIGQSIIMGPSLQCETHTVPVPAAAWTGLAALTGLLTTRKARQHHA